MLENSCGIAVIAVSFGCPCSWRFHRCSSWTRCYASLLRLVSIGHDSALLCSFHRCSSWTRSFEFPVVGAEADSYGQTCSLNTMIDVHCCTGHGQVSLVSGSLLFGVRCSPVEYQTTDFPGLQEIFTYSALSGSTVDTCWRHSTRLLEDFHTFLYVKVAGPAVLSCRRGEDTRAPTVASLNSGLVVACPLCASDRVLCGRCLGSVHRRLWTSCAHAET